MKLPRPIEGPYVLFIGDRRDDVSIKTATGICHWRPEKIAGQLIVADSDRRLGLAEFSTPELTSSAAKTLVIGVAPAGGELPEEWIGIMCEALRSGLDIASGLHTRLGDIDVLATTARDCGRQIHDVRFPTSEFDVGSGAPRSGRRLLTVGTDCSVGKMYSALYIDAALRKLDIDCDFRATGQTGILISGAGVSVDAVIADFVAGAVEALTPLSDDDHWDVIEGQGSLFHPAFAGVSLGLLHGSQPDALVLCHDAARTSMTVAAERPLPDLADCVDLNLRMARMTNPEARFVGACINTSTMSGDDARAYLSTVEENLGIPCIDPVRESATRIAGRIAEEFR